MSKIEKDSNKATDMLLQIRHQIARDIHDSLAQTLASIQLRIEILERNLYRHKADKEILNNTFKIKHDVRLANHEIRNLIHNFRSPQIEYFHNAVNNLIKKFRDDSDIQIFLQYNCATLPFDIDIKTEIYHIIQESLVNIKKHSKARFVRILLTCTNRLFELIIEDDGIGFLPNTVDKNIHFGLSVMQERAQQLSGNIKIESDIDDGCRIKFSLKIQ